MQLTGNLRATRLIFMAAIALFELLSIIIAYQLLASFECQQTEMWLACRALRSMTARGMAVMTILAIFFWLRPKAYTHLQSLVASTPGHPFWGVVHIVGVATIFTPLLTFGPTGMAASFGTALTLMAFGGLLAAFGAIFWVTPTRVWRDWLRQDGYLLLMAIFGAFLVPDLANLIQPVWNWASLSDLTFFLVYVVLVAFGVNVGVEPEIQVIGVDDFYVQVASQCSGVEGIALITIFMGIYAFLMRGDIRQQRYWLVLFPLAVFVSWLFNIARIALLILIGAHVSPEHALNGFHSYAGWLLFTALALGVVVIAHRARWLHVSPQTAQTTPQSWAEDDVIALIVPFIVMMLSGVVTAAFWPAPETAYPFRVAIMFATLLFFRRSILAMWVMPTMNRGWPLALGAGLLVAVLWLVTAPQADVVPAPANFSWIVFRVFGTVALVPLIEELLFRRYLLSRLNFGKTAGLICAVAVSSLLFGLMHDRFVAGTLSGIVFAGIYLRAGGLASAVVAHTSANAIIAAWAVISASWALI